MYAASKILTCSASFMFGLAVLATGSVVGVNPVYAQSGECGCVVAAGTTGIVESVNGNVFVSQANGSVPAQSKMRLRAGNSMLVGPQSASVVRFGGNCTLSVPANTVFEILPQGGKLCLALNEQAPAATQTAGGLKGFVVPGVIIAGATAGVLAIAASDSDNAVSK